MQDSCETLDNIQGEFFSLVSEEIWKKRELVEIRNFVNIDAN